MSIQKVSPWNQYRLNQVWNQVFWRAVGLGDTEAAAEQRANAAVVDIRRLLVAEESRLAKHRA